MILEFRPSTPGYTGEKQWPINTEIPAVSIFTEDLPVGFPLKPFYPFLISLKTCYAITVKVRVLDTSLSVTSSDVPPVMTILLGSKFKDRGLGGGIKKDDKDYYGRFYQV